MREIPEKDFEMIMGTAGVRG